MSKKIEKDIIDAVEEYSEDDEILSYYYDKEQNDRAIYNGDISLARKEGKEEGIKEGINQSKIEIAKKMLEDKYNIEEISKLTGLSIKEIKELIKK